MLEYQVPFKLNLSIFDRYRNFSAANGSVSTVHANVLPPAGGSNVRPVWSTTGHPTRCPATRCHARSNASDARWRRWLRSTATAATARRSTESLQSTATWFRLPTGWKWCGSICPILWWWSATWCTAPECTRYI